MQFTCTCGCNTELTIQEDEWLLSLKPGPLGGPSIHLDVDAIIVMIATLQRMLEQPPTIKE